MNWDDCLRNNLAYINLKKQLIKYRVLVEADGRFEI